MFGLGWIEILVITAIAVMVVPTKDLPVLMRNVGQGIGKMRRMATQFQRELDAAVRDEEIDKLRKEMNQLSRDTERDLRAAGSQYQREIKTAAKVDELEKTRRDVSQAGFEVEQALQRVGPVGRQPKQRAVSVEKPGEPAEPAMTPLSTEPESDPPTVTESEPKAEEVDTKAKSVGDEPLADVSTAPEPEPAKP